MQLTKRIRLINNMVAIVRLINLFAMFVIKKARTL